jgi:hypothetical protein
MSTVTDFTSVECIKSNYRLVRERSFTSNHDDLLQVVLQLRAERVTGTMTIDFSQGGINRVRFREEQDIRYEQK